MTDHRSVVEEMISYYTLHEYHLEKVRALRTLLADSKELEQAREKLSSLRTALKRGLPREKDILKGKYEFIDKEESNKIRKVFNDCLKAVNESIDKLFGD